MKYQVRVRVMPRGGVLDPQGKAVEHALGVMGFDGADDVRIGRAIDLAVDAGSPDEAEQLARAMCDRLLANPVTEDYELAVEAN